MLPLVLVGGVSGLVSLWFGDGVRRSATAASMVDDSLMIVSVKGQDDLNDIVY